MAEYTVVMRTYAPFMVDSYGKKTPNFSRLLPLQGSGGKIS
jgi:hypothetical protein